MKLYIKVLFTLILTLICLCSCTIWPGDGNGDTASDGGGNTSDGAGNNGAGGSSDTGDGGYTEGEIVYYRGVSGTSFDYAKKLFGDRAGVTLTAEAGGEGDKLFILGQCDLELSRKAYARMNRAFSQSDSTSIFTVYTDGKSVAIAYESEVACYAAIEYFFDNIEDFGTKSGFVTEEFNVESYVKAVRERERSGALQLFAERLGADAANMLGDMYSLYDSNVYNWLINLWDPYTGGFYYSNSARNTVGFLPDLESTAQALIFMSESGMLEEYDGKYALALPSDMRSLLLGFAKGTQDSEDGYFYHEQWGKSISSTRLGRDLGWATRIISGLGSTPYWHTPNGVKGEYGAPGVSAVSFRGTSTSRVSLLVSAVVPASLPSYLKDVNLFIKHLEEDFDWENNSYRAGNAIESDLGQIQNAGEKFTEALIEFLDSKQKSNGLWEDEISYDSINGLMKISVAYTSLNKPIPNADKAMESAIAVMKSSESPAHVCSVYNPWEAVANILHSMKQTSNLEFTEKIREQFRSEAEGLIGTTFEKLTVFKKNDGGFSYYVKYSAANSQGSPVALEKTEESDVNATNICTNSIVRAMFEVFGVEEVKRYGAIDFRFLSDTLSELGYIIKDEILPAEVITFDGYDKEFGEEEGGVVKYPDSFAENIVSDTEKGGTDYKWFNSSIVENPVSDADDLVLYSKTNVAVGEEKPNADKPSSTRFKIFNAALEALGNCYVYDADMYFVKGYGKTNSLGKKSSEPIIQLFFMTESLPCSSVNFSVYTDSGTDYVKIGENYSGKDGKQNNIAGKIPMGEWVNIRLEFYKRYEINDEGGEIYSPKLKIFVNGRYQGECDATITDELASGEIVYYDRKIDQVSVSYYRTMASEIYFNNVLVERCRKDYVAEVNPDAIINPPIPEESMRESYGFGDGLLNTSNVVNKVRVYDFGEGKYINAFEGQTYNPTISYSIVGDPTGASNRVLKVMTFASDYDKPSRSEVNLYGSDAIGDEYAFSGKFYYSSADIAKNGDLTHLVFRNSKDDALYYVRISAKKTDGVFKLSLIENNKDGTGTAKTLVDGIATDGWFELKIVLRKTGAVASTRADIYLNDTLVIKDYSYLPAALGEDLPTKIDIVHQKTNKSLLYLDDLSYRRTGEPCGEADKPVADFADGFNTKYVHSFGYNGEERIDVNEIDSVTMESLFTKFYLTADPKDSDNQVLRAVNKSGGTNAGYTRIDISNADPTGELYTLEMKMYIETFSKGYNLSQIKFVDKNGEMAFGVYVSIDNSTGKLKIASTGSNSYPTAGTNLLQGSAVNVAAGEWFTLRMELYHKGEESDKNNTYLKLFVNETLAFDGAAYRTLGAEIDRAEIVHCKTARSSAVYYDDIYLTRTDEKYKEGAD